eukprot:5993898-Amphidinium_carterae.1
MVAGQPTPGDATGRNSSIGEARQAVCGEERTADATGGRLRDTSEESLEDVIGRKIQEAPSAHQLQ